MQTFVLSSKNSLSVGTLMTTKFSRPSALISTTAFGRSESRSNLKRDSLEGFSVLENLSRQIGKTEAHWRKQDTDVR